MSVESAHARLRTSLTGSVRANEPLSRHTTYRIGGPAALFVECATVADVSVTLTTLAEEQVGWTVLGKGSNVLAADSGYDGAVIVLGHDFKRHSVEDDHLKTGAGVILAAVVQDAFKMGVSGLEFAVGIPGTVGGALAMNAGTRDIGMGSIVETVTLFEPHGGLVSVRGPEVAWGYRRSGLPARGIIVEAVLRVGRTDEVGIRRAMEASLRRRKRTQPLNVPSAGSVFRNPDGDSAARLIEAAGLKGVRIGGAAVSDAHANFIVNLGGATAGDVVALIRLIRQSVEEANGIELKPEIKFLGTFD